MCLVLTKARDCFFFISLLCNIWGILIISWPFVKRDFQKRFWCDVNFFLLYVGLV